MSRPEHIAPPEIYYGDDEARKYSSNTRVQHIQAEMTARALDLLNLPEWKQESGALLLDIGCGSGLSGEIISEEGHHWVGYDIAPSMLEVALEREVEGDLILADAGHGCPFRPGSFDGAISISALQWLLNADTNIASPIARLSRFFTMLHACLSHGARAALQFYPENDAQVELCMKAATKSGFGGGLVVDFPNSRKARKCFLIIWVGGKMRVPAGILSDEELALAEQEAGKQELPRGLLAEHENPDNVGQVKFEGRTTNKRGKKASKKARAQEKGSKDWILKKKELYRKRGKDDVPTDSKYTARKRRDVF
ncbi:hypothetical protein CBS101457_001731 [Exobasidium rhododendri]|nr:hypothetical protein CBS101457_001731 [Exobasidium rhododendri]